MESMEKKIREIAREIFINQKIDFFLGYEEGSVPLKSRPFFIQAKEKTPDGLINRLVWNSFCSNNLAVFLPKFFEHDPRKKPPRIGISVKGCDLRSIVALIKEKQVPRENIVLIGVPCLGMIDKTKVEANFQGLEIIGSEETPEGVLNITTKDGKKHHLKREEFLQEACIECRFPMTEGTDYLIEGKARDPGDGGYARIKAFEDKPPEERWEYFKREISKCIRCNACRQACPTCWCKECFAEQTDLRWIGASIDLSDTMIFHLIRIFHQAGRCVECDACYRACPMGVDLRMFTKKIVQDVDELFSYVPGFSTEDTPPMSTFREEDSDNFISEP